MDRVKLLLRAAIVLPVTSPPIDGGALVINGTFIEAVGNYRDIRRQCPSTLVEDLGDVVLMPGLVNAHTHLELTRLRDAIPDGLDFVSWLMELVRQKRRLSRDELVASTRQGIAESIACGVTAVGDIVTSDGAMEAVMQSLLTGVVFREVIGEGDLSPIPASASLAMKAGISPHSTYTVPLVLFRRIAELTRTSHTPLAIHAAESPEEIAFLKECSGPIADRIYPTARWPLPKPSGLSPAEFLESTGILAAKPLLIHGVQVSEDDVRTIARHGLSVVHCPGSNRRLGVGRFPLELYRRFGVNVALGTDSAIGTKRLDMFAEMREARRRHGDGLSDEEAVRMATVNGAAALELNAGVLAPGKRADLAVVELGGNDIYRSIVENGCPECVKSVFIGGQRHYG